MKVLLAVDESPAGAGAIRIAQDLLSSNAVTITVLHVMRGGRIARRAGPLASSSRGQESDRAAATRLLQAASDALRRSGVGPHVLTQLDAGDPVSSIGAALAASAPDLLVLGYRSAIGTRRLAPLRSRWDRLIAAAPCAVLVARPLDPQRGRALGSVESGQLSAPTAAHAPRRESDSSGLEIAP